MNFFAKIVLLINLLIMSQSYALIASHEAPKADPEAVLEEIRTRDAQAKSNPKDIVKTPDEFTKIIANDPFLIKYKANWKLTMVEISSIEAARRHQHNDYDGIFDKGRNIDEFKGNILVVGGGKHLRAGTLTALIEESQVDQSKEKLEEIKKIKIRNQEILDTYYSLNIDPKAQPDILASITSISDMAKIPDGRFNKVIFENVDAEVFLNPHLYPILERITQKGGEILFNIATTGKRLIIPMTRHTKWAAEIQDQLRKQIYENPEYESGTVIIKLKN